MMVERRVPGVCPVCGARMSVTRLHCAECDTAIEGRFAMCKFCYLNAEQRDFIETFIRCRGNIKEVERELGISYPTVRSRLDAVIQALGYRVESEPESRVDDSKRKVLEALNKGEISAEEALKIIKRS